ncbi:hypothetical protein LEP1GSC186_0513 [Leptospira noguchii serovar Autumnalis str. ZUN142]|uniref:Uncharacterized protein n=1 Tax=Leptospira noguchii serovar Autumnalis str. ZUN142 TaxID=1085540 RepID=M6UGY2_9LEPT|nr:hypothetical protein LEP1GSC186_0513 [Leptospira noguchii serovar Autumnalis str. ZUN142]
MLVPTFSELGCKTSTVLVPTFLDLICKTSTCVSSHKKIKEKSFLQVVFRTKRNGFFIKNRLSFFVI